MIEWTYWSGDFEIIEAQKACTKQGQGIATRVTKSGVRGMQTEARPRTASRARVWGEQSKAKQSKSKEKQRWIYT
jgi:hypothetical protein